MPHVLRERIHGVRDQIKIVAKQCFDLGIHDYAGVVKRLRTALPGMSPLVWQLLAQIVMEILKQWLAPAPAVPPKVRRRLPAQPVQPRRRRGKKAPRARG